MIWISSMVQMVINTISLEIIMEIPCSCSGKNENCNRCYGSGFLERQVDNVSELDRLAKETAKVVAYADPPPRTINIRGKIFKVVRQIMPSDDIY